MVVVELVVLVVLAGDLARVCGDVVVVTGAPTTLGTLLRPFGLPPAEGAVAE